MTGQLYAARSNIPLGVDLRCGVPFDLDDPAENGSHHAEKEAALIVGFGVDLAVEASCETACCNLSQNFRIDGVLDFLEKFHWYVPFFGGGGMNIRPWLRSLRRCRNPRRGQKP